MNIIICGLIGTGKTTLSKKISNDLHYKYIFLDELLNKSINSNDKLTASAKLNNDIENYLRDINNCVIDCEYLIMPSQYFNSRYKDNCLIIYLGFSSVDINVLVEKFKTDYEKRKIEFKEEELVNRLKYYKEISNYVCNECQKYNYKFFDIAKEKSIVLDDVYIYVLEFINQK